MLTGIRCTREYKITPIRGQIEVHEFDYKGEHAVIYEENGVTVRSWPAIHAGDEPVSFSIQYAGLKIVFGGDTVPNTWFQKFAKDADLVIHEAMMTPEQYYSLYGQPKQLAMRVCCEFHTSPRSFGKVMSRINPRHAVAYHFFNEEATRYPIYEGIRQTYDGPLSMATDLMVWNISKNKITERMAVARCDAWAVSGTAIQPLPEKGQPSPMSDYINAGRWVEGFKAQDPMLDKFIKNNDLQNQDWRPAMYKKLDAGEK